MATPIYKNRYQLGRLLGKGGMGAVYEAHDLLTRTTVALKSVLHTPNQLSFNSRSSFSNSHTALAHEFQLLASLRHPNIISVLDYGFASDATPFFTMTLLDDAVPITQAVVGKPIEFRVRLLMQLLQALNYLHRRGILHRDLKPSNVLVTPDHRVRVLDFGLAADYRDAAGVVGTIAYIAPEVLGGGAVTQAADLYAVGVIAYEMVTGDLPYDNRDSMQMLLSIMQGSPDFSMVDLVLAGEINPNSDVVPYDATTQLLGNAVLKTVPGDTNKSRMPKPNPHYRPLTAVIQQLMQKQPSSRYPNSQAVIRDLGAVLEKPIPLETEEVRESFLQAAAFVGRADELKTLHMALLDTDKGLGSAWLVGGESGVGKSRLLNELRVQALVSGIPVLRGQGVSDGGLPYQFWRDPLRELLLLVAVSDTDAAILARLVPDIEHILGRPIPPADHNIPDQDVVDTMVAIFQRLEHPVLLLLEDLHWANESLAVLERLQAVIDVLPLMIVASYRTEVRPHLPDRLPDFHKVLLDRLDRPHIEALSQSMLGTSGTSARIVDFIEQQTAGNCFFMVEVLRALAVEAGYLERIPTMVIPPDFEAGGVQAILRRRLESVPSWAVPLLEVAAVAGRVIDLVLMAQLRGQLAGGLNIERWLLSLSEVAVLEVRDNRWQFSHDKLREAVLSAVDAQHLRDLHADVAEAIEAVYPDDVSRAGILYQHWSAAGDPAKTRHYALIAGGQSTQRAQFDDATTYFNAVLALDPSVEQHAEALTQLARVNLQLGNSEDVASLLAQVFRVLPNDTTLPVWGDALQCQAEWHKGLGRLEDAAHAAQQALAIMTRHHLPDGRIRALVTLGDVHRQWGDNDAAVGYFNEALAALAITHDRVHECSIRNALAILYYFQNQIEEAEHEAQRALEITRELGLRREEYRSLNTLGGFAYIRGDLDVAEAYYQQAHQIVTVLGDKSGTLVVQNLASIYSDMGDFENAIRFYEQARRVHLQTGDRSSLINCLVNMSETYCDYGDLKLAADTAEAALENALALDAPSLICAAQLNLAIAHLHNHAVTTALPLLEAAILHEADDIHYEADLMLGVGLVLASEPERAKGYLTQAIEHAQAAIAEEEDLYPAWFTMGLAQAALGLIGVAVGDAAAAAYRQGVSIAHHAGILLHQRRLLALLAAAQLGDVDALIALLTPQERC